MYQKSSIIVNSQCCLIYFSSQLLDLIYYFLSPLPIDLDKDKLIRVSSPQAKLSGKGK